MNSLEAAYMHELRAKRSAGIILAYFYEAIKLRLAKACWYTPDFLVLAGGFVELHEVKGFWQDDARVKWKTAAELFPYFRFVAVTRKRIARGTYDWKYEYYRE